MAEVTGLRNNALPYPVYGAPWGVVVPILDADGDFVTGAASLDSEVSKNGDTFADCTNEATEVATSSGLYYLLLTATEMTADVVAVQIKTGTAGAKSTPVILYPRKLVVIRAGTAAGGAAGSITLDSGASAVDDYYNGALVVGVLDSATEARIITDYAGSTKVASVTPNWNTTPDSDDTFTVYLTEGLQINQANVTQFGGANGTFSGGRPEVNASHAAGTAWNSGAINANTLASDTIAAAKIAADALTAAKFAANAITAAKLDPDVTTELQAGLATAAELAKVPKSDSNVTWNATAAAQVQSEAADALNAYDPPTRAEATADKDEILVTTADIEGKVDDLESRLGTPSNLGSGATVAANLVDIEAQTDDIGVAGAGLTALATQTSVDDLPTNTELAIALGTADDAVLAQVALVKAKTDNLPSDPADASDIAGAFGTVNSTLATIAGYLDTELAAVLAEVLKLSASGIVRTGTAQAGGADTITLDAGASSVDDFYNYQVVVIAAGAGAGQARIVSDYVGSTRVATVNGNWATAPDDTSVFYLVPFGAIPGASAPTAAEIRQEIDDNSTQLAAIKAKTDNLPADPADASDIAASFASIASTLSTIAGYLDTEVAAIKAKTDNLPSDPADASDLAASFASLASTLSTIAGYIDTEVAAIKAKTDNLPSDPADQSAVEAAITAATSTLATAAALAVVATYVDTEVAAIKAKTDNLPADPADASDIAGAFSTVNSTLATIAGYLDTEIAAIKAKTDNLPSDPADQSAIEAAITAAQGVITALIAALNNLSAAQVKAQVDASVKTDARPEPASVAAANASMADKLDLLFALARNVSDLDKTTGVMRLRNDANSANIGSRTDSDDGTVYTKGELS